MGDEDVAQLQLVLEVPQRLITWARTETSSAEMGSSATISRGQGEGSRAADAVALAAAELVGESGGPGGSPTRSRRACTAIAPACRTTPWIRNRDDDGADGEARVQ